MDSCGCFVETLPAARALERTAFSRCITLLWKRLARGGVSMCCRGMLTEWMEATAECAGSFEPGRVSDVRRVVGSFFWRFCFLYGIQYKAMQNKREYSMEACAFGLFVSRGRPAFVVSGLSERLAQRVLLRGGIFV
jgi:hypothetical protein